ncbi:MAG: protein-(glutamine-N5) methyltransferase, release factor-specific [Arcobacter sp.]|nr:MAG: protein-(glutamine-N5) methyltransferase, release factor-specific [Arcobacter sp.]
MSNNTINDWIELGASSLREIAERPRREAEILLSSVLKKNRLYLITHADESVEAPLYEKMLSRRCDNEPIEYITSEVSFFSQDFYISKGALIPRPETEILIEKLLEKLALDTQESIVEVGVGSGIISIVLAQHLKEASFLATDISEDAITIAKKNLELKQMKERIKIIQTDLLQGIDQDIDILVSNPPYIEDGITLGENLSYEPQNALYGGEVGDEILQRLINEAFKRRVRILACEMGYDQKEKIQAYVKDLDYKTLEFYEDYAGHDRGFILELR